MRRILSGLAAVAALAVMAPLAAQSPPPSIREAFGPGLPSAELARLPQTPGAKGDQQRHYFFDAAGKEMPYRIYVPQNYDPKVGAPLVVALHGYNGNQNYFFSLVKDLPELCEEYGFIFVAPMGYSPGGWYGAPLNIPGDLPRSSSSRPAGANAPPPPPPAPPEPAKTPEEVKQERALSESDVMNVLARVRAEYKIDPARIYLMGHSMGGAGTWFLGQKYADIWAAIAPMSGSLPYFPYDFDRLKNVPVMQAVGGTETRTVETSKDEMAKMKTAGMTTAYVEIYGGTHMSMIPPSVPQIFAFFHEHTKRGAAAE